MSLLYTIEEFAEFVCGYGTKCNRRVENVPFLS